MNSQHYHQLPAIWLQLVMYFAMSGLLCIIIFCKQDISKTIWTIFPQFIAPVSYILGRVNFWCRSLPRWLTCSHFSFWYGHSGASCWM